MKISEYGLINIKWLEDEIKRIDLSINQIDSNKMSGNKELHRLRGIKKTLTFIYKNIINAEKLADYSYEAGKLDSELANMFDNTKGRFLKSETIKFH
jgi:hypothetical protein